MKHTVKIRCPLNSNESTVELDGRRLEGVTAIAFSIRANQATEITLSVLGYIEIDADLKETELLRVERRSDIGHQT